ncbi:hypothetical protein PoB_005381800 [Plakobranchus ocellatus]|uniref:Uncharacterized protein n=1 Tax=Plakobranchus ocellatus TaxID=259542 RepID=A0AAV4C8I4_9GAST|nr:hypothetical protein PoB_005381800 [Plakobranchus ocellatus]
MEETTSAGSACEGWLSLVPPAAAINLVLKQTNSSYAPAAVLFTVWFTAHQIYTFINNRSSLLMSSFITADSFACTIMRKRKISIRRSRRRTRRRINKRKSNSRAAANSRWRIGKAAGATRKGRKRRMEEEE